jgi:hypothetical protein
MDNPALTVKAKIDGFEDFPIKAEIEISLSQEFAAYQVEFLGPLYSDFLQKLIKQF